MCGIIGYIGKEKAAPILVKGLKNLEYRGYDSAGFSTIDNGTLLIAKDTGKLNEIELKININELHGCVGISHCRWATHGNVTQENAHPHTDCTGRISIVHNGIIENFSELKEMLIAKNHKFSSSTDTEVISHLIEEYYTGNLPEAVRKALKEVEGSYALGVLSADEPDIIVAARNESPLIIGKGKNAMFIASDVPAILEHTNEIIYLDDKEIAVLTKSNFRVFDLDGREKKKEIKKISWSMEDAEKGGYEHFMLKEIYEQPRAIEDTINGRLKNGTINIKEELGMDENSLKKISKIIIVACGTSWHSALVGEFMLEELAKIPVEVEYASEFRYRNPIVDADTLVIGISQSGETADTIAAMKEAKRRGAHVISICNVMGSSITRISDAVLYTRAGPEIGVASTKAFTTQLAVLYLLTMHFAKLKNTLTEKQLQSMAQGIRKIPLQMQAVLEKDAETEELAHLYHKSTNALYLGRGANFPIALEGALKMKEVSYIHAEGYPAAEMKHGPIALIDKNMPVVFVAPYDTYTYKKILGNIEEVKARGGIVIAIATEGDREVAKKAGHVIYIPDSLYTLSSMLSVIPLQLLAYHTAKKLGKDVDKPRSLAKSVTVE
ncbi:glutamine--fructose-6-phosphate transaminase (isomerizing) [Candidatus Woesearchaeota archaeon]|nr:glutamine--fructose-6-phosphate transaminase (isomerizing) [Candidatus Woesearchaeota archaeon]